jgi:glycosyltransferase involved in cell wall biosynthesis
MKILLINNSYQQRGSTDAIVSTEKRLLEDHGEEVYCYARDNNEISIYSLADKMFLPFETIYSRRTCKDLQGIIKTFRPDVAYIHNFLPLISPSVYHVLHAEGVPSIQVMHEFRLLCPNSHFYTHGKICERCKDGNYLHAVRFRCYRDSYLTTLACAAALGINRMAGMLDKISVFLCLTEFSKKKLLEIGIPAHKLHVRPHSIDTSTIQPCFEQGDYILYLGRLSEEKGLLTLIRAVGGLKQSRLKIAGSGPGERQLRECVLAERLTNIEFVGHKEGKDKWALLRHSALVVVPSEWYETFCMVVIESQAAGKPVIASNIGSLPYVVEDGKTGLLFDPGNVEDLQSKIRFLLERPEEAAVMGRQGRATVERKNHPEANYRVLMDVFRSCTGVSPSVPAEPIAQLGA